MGVFLRKLKHHLLPRKEFKLKSKSFNLKWLGSRNGGFYFDTKRIQTDDIVLSFGVGTDITFDLQLIDEVKCKVYGFDPTPKSINWISKQDIPDDYVFCAYGISKESGDISFFLPKNEDHVSGSLIGLDFVDSVTPVNVPVRCMNDIIKKIDPIKVVAVKMDIEGTEYDVMNDVLSSLPNLNQIAVEIHERFVEDGVSKTKEMIAKLEVYGFKLAAISESLEELTFLK